MCNTYMYMDVLRGVNIVYEGVEERDVQYTVYNIQYTIHNIQYTLYSIHYTVYIIQYTVYM